MSLKNDPSAVKIVDLDDDGVLLAKVSDGPLPKGDYEIKVEIVPLNPGPAHGSSCGLCCQVLQQA